MKFTIFITILLVAIFKIRTINGKINIDIQTVTNSSDVTINYSGGDVKLVTEHEIEQFKITDANLKQAVKAHYGTKPSSVYLKSPTPWGDLYKTYNWEQIKRILTIKSARVKGINKKPVIVLSQDFENSFNNTIKVNAGISQTVENTVTSSWTRNKEIAVSQEVEFDVNILIAKVTGSTGFSFTSSWGESEEHSETYTIGTTSAVEIELKPGQKATAVLSANRGFVEIEIIYVATLRGNLAVNFKRMHNGHHFWGPSIGNVLKSGGLKQEVTATEVMKIGFYSDANLKVFDKDTGEDCDFV